MPRLTVVVPCYNEAERLDAAPLLAYVDTHADASLLLVNDGSKDATGEVLERIATPGAREVLKGLADGAPGAWLTREARAALGRLGR